MVTTCRVKSGVGVGSRKGVFDAMKTRLLLCAAFAFAQSGIGLFAADSAPLDFEYVPASNARYWQARNPSDGKVRWDWGDATSATLQVVELGTSGSTTLNFTEGTDAPEWTIPDVEERVYDLTLTLSGGAETVFRTARIAKLAAAQTILASSGNQKWKRIRAGTNYILPIDSAWYNRSNVATGAVQVFTRDVTPQTKLAHLTLDGGAGYTVLSTSGFGRYAKYIADLSFDAVYADQAELDMALGLMVLVK